MKTSSAAALGRRLAALTITAGLALSVAGCSDGSPQQDRAWAGASKAGNSAPREQQGQENAPLAELQGQNGLALTITSADRDPAGYLTVRGDLKNDGAEKVVVPANLRGNELDVLKNGQSFGGATVVDFAGRKRYYVLRDTEGRPLTTTGLTYLKAGESVRVYMQFPAPPTGTTAVGFQLPLFDTATIKLSG